MANVLPPVPLGSRVVRVARGGSGCVASLVSLDTRAHRKQLLRAFMPRTVTAEKPYLSGCCARKPLVPGSARGRHWRAPTSSLLTAMSVFGFRTPPSMKETFTLNALLAIRAALVNRNRSDRHRRCPPSSKEPLAALWAAVALPREGRRAACSVSDASGPRRRVTPGRLCMGPRAVRLLVAPGVHRPQVHAMRDR